MRAPFSLYLPGVLAIALAMATTSIAAPLPEPAHTVELWPALAGKSTGEPVAGKDDGILRLTNVASPSIAVFPALAGDGRAPAVLVCPGGGYGILAYDLEGTEIAQWLNTLGITAVVLKYRVPDNREGAFADAQRAISLLRHNRRAWGIDAGHIGILGFSAGGHLAARTSAPASGRSYTPVDDADQLRCTPDFTVLVYPAYLADAQLALPPEVTISRQTPPAFIVQTQDDKNYIDSSLAYYIAMKSAGKPAELHLFPEGGHGYGLRPSNHAVSGWPDLCGAWLSRVVKTQPIP